jgi:small-conductance mechanosensitive channel
MRKYIPLIFAIAIAIAMIFLQLIIDSYFNNKHPFLKIIYNHSNIFITLSIAWLFIQILHSLKQFLINKYDISKEDNLKSRKVITQINLLEKVIILLIIIFTVGVILLSFENIRKIGIGLFASAGLAGIIIGFSAQKVIGALIAGLQIAIAQPFRIDDAVVVENEWGWIEEINLTYVVVRIWDKRRLVLPSTYFLEKPFQNWTRTTAEIVGTVFLYTDYSISFQALREELTRILNGTDLWDKKVNVLQVTESKEFSVETRILVSAKNSPTAWDLRVHVREKMIEFIQNNYPDALPKARISMIDKSNQIS